MIKKKKNLLVLLCLGWNKLFETMILSPVMIKKKIHLLVSMSRSETKCNIYAVFLAVRFGCETKVDVCASLWTGVQHLVTHLHSFYRLCLLDAG